MVVTQGNVNAQEDVVISLGVDLTNLKKQLASAKSVIQAKALGIQSQIQALNFTPTGRLRSSLPAKQKKELKSLQVELKRTRLEQAKLAQASKRHLQGAAHGLEIQKQKLRGISNQFKRQQDPPFQGWAMSIMFFGMAMQRVFTSIWKSSSKTFQDVMHSTKGTVTEFDKLDGSIKYLGFTLGQALEPMAPIFMNIVDWIQRFTEKFPKLTKWVLIATGILGTFLFIVGTLALGLVGSAMAIKRVVWAFQLLKKLQLITWLTKVIAKFKIFNGTKKASLALDLTMLAVWVAWTALIVIAIALIISIGATWKQIAEGYKIKALLMVSYFQSFVLQLKKGLINLKYSFIYFGNVVKLIMLETFNSIGNGIANVFNKIINIVNKALDLAKKVPMAPQWLKNLDSIGSISFEGADTAGVKADIESVALDWYNALAKVNEKQKELEDERWDLFQQGAANETTAAENFKNAWLSILDSIKGKQDEVSEAIAPKITPTTDGTTTIDNSQTIINIQPQQEGESMEDFANRILERMREGMV